MVRRFTRFTRFIDWMDRRELVQAIPPAYTEFIGRQFLGWRAR